MKPLRLALVGENIGYSRSPEIFNTMFQILGVEGRFDLHSVSATQLAECVERLRTDGTSGFSVTIPHKQAIMNLVDSLDSTAQAVGAVNSVSIRGNKLAGYNTDCDGFSFALRRHGFTGCTGALILGSGGAARAVVYALNRDFGLTQFVVVGRNTDRLTSFVRHFESIGRGLSIKFGVDAANSNLRAEDCQLVVNCTPVGGPDHEQEKILPAEFAWDKVDLYHDLNYNTNNLMLSAAQRAGTAAMDGSVMLVAQAVRSLELWTGLTADFERVYDAVFKGR